MEKLLILGAGGYGRTVAEAAAYVFSHIAFLDDGQTGPDILGPCARYEALRGQYDAAYPAFGDNALRAAFMEKLLAAGYTVPAIVHPRAFVSPSAVLEPGAVVLAGACVGTRAAVRQGAILNLGAIADHDTEIGPAAHLAPGAIIGAGNRIPAGMKVEAGVVVGRGARLPGQGGIHV